MTAGSHPVLQRVCEVAQEALPDDQLRPSSPIRRFDGYQIQSRGQMGCAEMDLLTGGRDLIPDDCLAQRGQKAKSKILSRNSGRQGERYVFSGGDWVGKEIELDSLWFEDGEHLVEWVGPIDNFLSI